MPIRVPIKVLHKAEGHIVTLETITGEVYRGKLIEAEDNMNLSRRKNCKLGKCLYSRIENTIPHTAGYVAKCADVQETDWERWNAQLSPTTVHRQQELKMASIGLVDVKFPVGSLVPKAETNSLNFLQKYPDYDGRDVIIAILDSGVDPRVAGLQTIPNGDVKVIERFDCSGCGDTDTTKKVSADENGYLVGLSGRSLKLTNFMKTNNLDGTEYRIGLKSLHDLYPSKIREKVANDEKSRFWDSTHKIATADVLRQLQNFESSLTDPQSLALKDKLKKEDLDGYLDFLNNLEKKYFDAKTSFDCVLFKTDTCWYAVIDTTETGDLENAVLIGEYSKTHEVKNVDNFLSISINVHDEGNALEIVGMCSSHGTHVASIASGNHSDKELDGVAPNAKIVSLTIGDGRLGSMETGTALVRAIIKVMELCNSGTKIDVINMSYGEHAAWSNSGRIGALMNEVVNKYGVVWVASAGNHGPALCTIGTPPDISQPSCIGVGAYVSPQMMEAEYAFREKLPANVYTWTSRDPCIDGGQGVTVCAPGAAITSVPEYTMTRAQLMNGTSMAAPHVAGAIALLISGLKQRNIKYSPYSIKRAIWNTATRLDYVDTFAQGNGLLNVEKAFENLIQYANQQENLIRFSIRVGNQNSKGIHLRHGLLRKAVEYNVNIEPVFFNEKETAPKNKINFNVRLALMPSEPWVQCGQFLDLCYVSRSIIVRIDPTGLQPGVHKASVKGYDTACVEKGPLFEIPITVVQPIIISTDDPKKLMIERYADFKPNTINRSFILVPQNATWAVLRMISINERDNNASKFFVHTMQTLPLRYCKYMETMKILPVNNQNETVHAFKCEQNNILELCIAKYWSNFGDTQLKFTLEFHGITASGNSSNVMHSANGIHRIDITSLANEEISPGAQLKTATMVLKPIESKVTPLTSRDVLPEGRQIYQNVLTYNLHLTKAQELAVHCPLLSSMLYESEYESQFWMLFDSNKMMVACGDAYSYSQYNKLEKGDYQIKLQVRHEKKEILEKLSEATMIVIFKLQSPITLDIYEHYNQAIVGGKKSSSFQLGATSTKTLYVAPLSSEKLNKSSLPSQCSWLSGSIAYVKDEVGRKVDNNSLQYVLIEGPGTKKSNGSSPKKNNSNGKTKVEEYKEGLRDYQCSMISKLDLEAAEKVYKDILATFPKHFPAHLAFIQLLESTDNTTNLPFAFAKSIGPNSKDSGDKIDSSKITSSLNRIVEIASIVINETDQDALLTYYGMKTDTRPDAAKIKVNMDKNKNTLIETLCKKGIALCKLAVIDSEKSKETSGFLEDIDTIYSEIGKFIDPMDQKALYFTMWHAYVHSQYGRLAKCLQKSYEDKANREILEELQSLSLVKNWDHINKQLRRYTVYSNPITYRPF